MFKHAYHCFNNIAIAKHLATVCTCDITHLIYSHKTFQD